MVSLPSVYAKLGWGGRDGSRNPYPSRLRGPTVPFSSHQGSHPPSAHVLESASGGIAAGIGGARGELYIQERDQPHAHLSASLSKWDQGAPPALSNSFKAAASRTCQQHPPTLEERDTHTLPPSSPLWAPYCVLSPHTPWHPCWSTVLNISYPVLLTQGLPGP